MKKIFRIAGVTLLEVMLVLAVAAMIIVMSVRYYQTATTNQQVTAALSIIQGISAAADGLGQGSGSYSTGGVSTTTIAQLMPSGVKNTAGTAMTSPWGGAITIGSVTASTYQITFDKMTQAVCALVKSRLTASSKFSTSSTCSTTLNNTLTLTYDNAG